MGQAVLICPQMLCFCRESEAYGNRCEKPESRLASLACGENRHTQSENPTLTFLLWIRNGFLQPKNLPCTQSLKTMGGISHIFYQFSRVEKLHIFAWGYFTQIFATFLQCFAFLKSPLHCCHWNPHKSAAAYPFCVHRPLGHVHMVDFDTELRTRHFLDAYSASDSWDTD